MVGVTDALRLCSVCVSKVGAVMDAEAGVVGPEIDLVVAGGLKRPDDPGGPLTDQTREGH